MTDPDEEIDDLDLPEHLSDEARDLICGVLKDLEAAGEEPDAFLWGNLMQAAELISTADALDEVGRAAGHVSRGSAGQVVTHPATVEARLARSSAAGIVEKLRPKQETRHRYNSRTGAAAAAAGHRRRRGSE